MSPDSLSTTTYSVTYTFSSGTLTRTALGTSRTLLSGVTSPTTQGIFNYLDKQGTTLSTTYAVGVRQIELNAFTATNGQAVNGTLATFTGASSRFVLRSKHLVN